MAAASSSSVPQARASAGAVRAGPQPERRPLVEDAERWKTGFLGCRRVSPRENEIALLQKVCCFCEYNDRRLRFPGAQPVPLLPETAEFLLTERYAVCEKTDGERMMLLQAHSQIYLVDRNNYVYDVADVNEFRREFLKNDPRAGPSFLDTEHGNTLLDGELVVQRHDFGKDEVKYRIIFMVFDAIFVDGRDVKFLLLPERLRLARRWITPRQQRSAFGKLSVCVKTFRNLGDIREVLAKLNTQKHLTDGLIFTPIDEPYETQTAKRTLKWKPPELCTSDFAVRLLRPTSGVLLDFGDLLVENENAYSVHTSVGMMLQNTAAEETLRDHDSGCLRLVSEWLQTGINLPPNAVAPSSSEKDGTSAADKSWTPQCDFGLFVMDDNKLIYYSALQNTWDEVFEVARSEKLSSSLTVDEQSEKGSGKTRGRSSVANIWECRWNPAREGFCLYKKRADKKFPNTVRNVDSNSRAAELSLTEETLKSWLGKRNEEFLKWDWGAERRERRRRVGLREEDEESSSSESEDEGVDNGEDVVEMREQQALDGGDDDEEMAPQAPSHEGGPALPRCGSSQFAGTVAPPRPQGSERTFTGPEEQWSTLAAQHGEYGGTAEENWPPVWSSAKEGGDEDDEYLAMGDTGEDDW